MIAPARSCPSADLAAGLSPPRLAASRTATAAITSAVIGSANHQPARALAPRANQQRTGEVGAEHVLSALGPGRGRAKPLGQPALGNRQRRHGRQGHRCKRDSDPTGFWMTRTEELAQSLNRDISRDYVEADPDQAVGPLLGGLRAVAIPRRNARAGRSRPETPPPSRRRIRAGDRSAAIPAPTAIAASIAPGDTNPGQQPRLPDESQSPKIRTGLCYRECMRLHA